jgi:hypothetical protein
VFGIGGALLRWGSSIARGDAGQGKDDNLSRNLLASLRIASSFAGAIFRKPFTGMAMRGFFAKSSA